MMYCLNMPSENSPAKTFRLFISTRTLPTERAHWHVTLNSQRLQDRLNCRPLRTVQSSLRPVCQDELISLIECAGHVQQLQRDLLFSDILLT